MIADMKKIVGLIICLAATYGLGRVYYHVTDGFVEKNIHYERAADPKYEIAVSPEKMGEIKEILSSPFYYLGKGCQSYVFEDKTHRYVIKFLKYQRYRPHNALSYFTFIPWIARQVEERTEKKLSKIDNVYRSWKTSLVMAPDETGVLYVHLNKTKEFDRPLIIYDKIGLKHEIDLNAVEFLLQRKAQLLTTYLTNLVNEKREEEVLSFLQNMIDQMVDGFKRGISDNDYALLQNTGVADGHAVYIDVGQIIYNPIVRDPKVYGKELFNKTYKFRQWLRDLSPVVADQFDGMVAEAVGPDFYTMPPYVNKSNMGDLPNLFEE